MTDKAIVVLPPRPESTLRSDRLDPLTHVGGLPLLQRTLLGLQWAGVQEGILLAYGPWPDAERLVRQDRKNRTFTWICLPEMEPGSPGELRLRRLLAGSFVLQFPGWIVDRKVIRDLLRDETAGKSPSGKTVLVRPSDPSAVAGSFPPLALVHGGSRPELARSLLEKAPIETLERELSNDPDLEVRPLGEPSLIRAERRQDRDAAEGKLLQGLIKPTESWLSRNFERKVSLGITRRLLGTGITPNQISLFSLSLGLGSALFFLSDRPALHVCGALLLLLSSIVDGCDGELARLRFQESRAGSWLDFLGDNLVHMAVFFCIGLGLYRHGAGVHYLLLGGLGALCTLLAASLVFRRVLLASRTAVITFATPVRLEEMEQATGSIRRQIDFADRISNRDFIYVILLLALAGHLWIFAWFSGLGSAFYLANLLYLYRRMGILGGKRDPRPPA